MLVIGVLSCVAGLLALGCLAAANSRKRWANSAIYRASAAICSAGFVCAAAGLVAGDAQTLMLPIGLPWLGMHFRIDALAAVFLCVVNLGGVAASVFALGYGRHEPAPQRVLPFYPAFLAAMNLVVIADDAFAFLLSWEFMSLLSWALVVSHDHSKKNMRAGLVYIVMAGLGTMALLLAFAILAGPGGQFAFSAMRLHGLIPMPRCSSCFSRFSAPDRKRACFRCMPGCRWPIRGAQPCFRADERHHEKVAVYAFIRIALDLLGPIHWRLLWWLSASAPSPALLGVLYALMQHDLKRFSPTTRWRISASFSWDWDWRWPFAPMDWLLQQRSPRRPRSFMSSTICCSKAYCSSAPAPCKTQPASATWTIWAAHPQDAANGHRVSHRRGGDSGIAAAQRFRLGVADIPGRFLSPAFPQWGLRLLAPASAAILALSAALAAACFESLRGDLLGRARSETADLAKETDKASLAAMFGLAGACGIAGIFPGLFTNLLGPVSKFLTSTEMPVQAIATPLLPVADSHNSYSGLMIGALLVLATALIVSVVRLVANSATRRSAAWDCGYNEAARSPNTVRKLCAADTSRLRHTYVPRPREGRHARAHRHGAGAVHTVALGSGMGSVLCPGEPGCRLFGGSSQSVSVPHNKALPRRGVRHTRYSPHGAGAMGMTAFALLGLQTFLVIARAPLLTGIVRKTKARAATPRGTGARFSLIAISSDFCAKRPCSQTTRRGCSRPPHTSFARQVGPRHFWCRPSPSTPT